jgi:phosphoribosylanthranilate isomerase
LSPSILSIRPLLKICGITNINDAQFALKSGANLLGFIMAPSPRRVTVRRAAELVKNLRRSSRGKSVLMTGVFMNARRSWVLSAAREIGLDLLQLHGSESPEYVSALKAEGFKVLKTIKCLGTRARAEMKRFPEAWAFLLEPARSGPGRSKPKNPNFKSARIAAAAHKRVGVAGGVSSDNLQKVLADVGTDLWLVDAASSLELSPGRKDPVRVTAFCRQLAAYRSS